jgi:hypothetical protein
VVLRCSTNLTSTFNGEGIFRPGRATYNANTVMNVGIVDLDDGNQTLNGGADLTINADAIDTLAGDGFDGVMTLSDASTLTVNIAGGGSWDFEGTLTYNGNAGFNTFLAGSTIDLENIFNITGKGFTSAPINVMTGGRINLASSSDELRLSVNTLMLMTGGQVLGTGRLSSLSGGDVTGYGLIATAVDFDGTTSDIRAAQGTLTLSGAIVDVGTIGTADDFGTLSVTNAWNTSVANNVILQGGSITGGTITNSGTNGISGFGLVSALVINNTSVNATAGGTLILQTSSNNNDWDGATESGALNAVSGNLTLRDNASFPFDGTVRAEAGRTVFADGFELEFQPASTLTLNGGTFRATTTTHIGGMATVDASDSSTIRNDGITLFESTSNTTLNGDLRLDSSNTLIAAGAAFSGPGALINLPERVLTLSGGADLGVQVTNQGDFEIAGAGVGSAEVTVFIQSAEAVAHFDIGGLGLGNYDRLEVTGATQVNGELDLFFSGEFTPALGQTFDIIVAEGGVTGAFSVVDQPLGLPAGLLFDVVYLPTIVRLQVVAVLPGDFNSDGTVDAADYVVWRKTDGTPAGYNTWRANFGRSPGSGSVAAVNANVPEPAALVILIIAAAGASTPRRWRTWPVPKLINV